MSEIKFEGMKSVNKDTMDIKQKAMYILTEMEKLFPDGESELKNWETPFQFLICILLSAQTTDKLVNTVTKELFKKYPTAKEMAKAKVEDVENFVSSVNYYRNKSKYMVKTANILMDEYDGNPPTTVKELVKLAGIGEKTANVFLNDLYQMNSGIGVDTHVLRVSNRLGLSNSQTTKGVAKDLQEAYPQDVWYRVNTAFVLYGRYVCKARVKPEESECVFKEYCSWCGKGE